MRNRGKAPKPGWNFDTTLPEPEKVYRFPREGKPKPKEDAESPFIRTGGGFDLTKDPPPFPDVYKEIKDPPRRDDFGSSTSPSGFRLTVAGASPPSADKASRKAAGASSRPRTSSGVPKRRKRGLGSTTGSKSTSFLEHHVKPAESVFPHKLTQLKRSPSFTLGVKLKTRREIDAAIGVVEPPAPDSYDTVSAFKASSRFKHTPSFQFGVRLKTAKERERALGYPEPPAVRVMLNIRPILSLVLTNTLLRFVDDSLAAMFAVSSDCFATPERTRALLTRVSIHSAELRP